MSGALTLAYALLAKRPLFELEIRAKLAAAGFSATNVDAAVERLQHQGVLNDKKLVNELLQKNVGRKAISNHLLMEKLRLRGAPETEQLVDQVQSIDELLSMRFSPDGQMKEKAKAARFLSSRGFEPEEVEAAIERYFVK